MLKIVTLFNVLYEFCYSGSQLTATLYFVAVRGTTTTYTLFCSDLVLIQTHLTLYLFWKKCFLKSCEILISFFFQINLLKKVVA